LPPYLAVFIYTKNSNKRYTYLGRIRQRIGFFDIFLHFLVAVDIFFGVLI